MDIERRREYRETIGNLENEKRKLKFVTLGGTLITTVALALELFAGGLIKPNDAGYYFTSDKVTMSQEDPEDYTSKNYTVYFGDGRAKTFTFEDLERIEPNINGGYTFVSSNMLPEGEDLGIQRVETNPDRQLFNGIMFTGALASLGAAAASQGKIKKVNEEENEYKDRMRR